MIGDAVRVRLGLDVDLSNPDLELFVEVDSKELLVSTERLRGAGGLPVGSSGRALVLLSGGLDSPVAAYRMMKRGLRCDFVHFSGRPFTGPGVDLQGIRARRPPRPLPGRLAAVRRLLRNRPAPARDRGRRAAAGALAAAADGEGGVGARPARARRGARHGRLARPGRLARRCRTWPWSRRRPSSRCCAR